MAVSFSKITDIFGAEVDGVDIAASSMRRYKAAGTGAGSECSRFCLSGIS